MNILFRFTRGFCTITSRMFAAILYSLFFPVQAEARVWERWVIIDPDPHIPLFCFLHIFLARKSSYLTDNNMA